MHSLLGGATVEINPQVPIMDLGLDSLAVTQLMREISSELKIRLPATTIFDHPTIQALTAHLTNLLSRAKGSATRSKPQLATPVVQRQDTCCDEVAVIGSSCRFPGGVEGLERFWDVIQAGRSVVGKVPFSRWDVGAVALADVTLSVDVRLRMSFGGFVDDLELFDASFFHIAPAEAISMDPQQRLLLEYTYLAFVDAGYGKDLLCNKDVGVFVGIGTADATELSQATQRKDVYSANSSSHSTAAGRISFVFGLHGPCIAYDTACSSVGVALHAATRALQAKECEMAVVAGVSAMLTPRLSTIFAITGMTSATGRCHTFDESADGYVRSEGCGVLLLQTSRDASAHGKCVRATIRGAGEHTGVKRFPLCFSSFQGLSTPHSQRCPTMERVQVSQLQMAKPRSN